MLSNNYRNQIVDICCRIISTDGEVSLEERIWMNKLTDHNKHANALVGSLFGSDLMEDTDDFT